MSSKELSTGNLPGPDTIARHVHPGFRFLPPSAINHSAAGGRASRPPSVVSGSGHNNCRDLQFCQLPKLLKSGDLLVLNNTQVVMTRLMAQKTSGGRAEVLLVSIGVPSTLAALT